MQTQIIFLLSIYFRGACNQNFSREPEVNFNIQIENKLQNKDHCFSFNYIPWQCLTSTTSNWHFYGIH